MRDFDYWLAQMRKSINTYSFYVDFDKVYANVEAMKIELNILNSLIGSQNVEKDIRFIFEKYPETLKCIPTLLAVRQNEIYAQDEEGSFSFNFSKPNYSIDEYIMFMRKTGLLNLISEHIVNNLVDYALGIETGLDSNGRKNRGGHQMENLVELYLKKANVEYYKEMYLTEVESKWDIDLSAISAEGTTTKRWDFVVKTQDKVYVIETNFYSAGGSKLNETSRSYKMIAEEAKTIPNFEFMWITDGGGWRSARRNLAETFNVMEHIYNITDMENGVFDKVFH
ncbi:type II restriction endonuclease [Enterococcus cecorum]|uniref:type II restriction endonuclease n=2 Tax=Enterococcus cecorum TaxID=44008 RepID=UPI00148DC006|nr:type II restriction endonuclease [Enterococcus cecorum]MDZ5584412.1 type II restriction endonuclease [Enterococcus cecorum]